MSDANFSAEDVVESGRVAALTRRVERLEKVGGKAEMPWYRTPSNVISLLAVVVTLAVFLISFVYGQQAAQFEKRQALLSVVEELSALTQEETRLAQTDMPEIAKINAYIAFANRRGALVTQADNLLDDVASETSRLDLSILSAAYAGVGRYEQAERHFRSLAEAQDEPMNLRVMAWRSLISLYFAIGPSRIADAVEAYDAGMQLLSDETDVQSAVEKVLISMSLSEGLLALRRYEEAAPYVINSERRAWDLPCAPVRTQMLETVQRQVRRLFLSAPESVKGLSAVREDYSKGCAVDPHLIPLSTEEGGIGQFVGQYRGRAGRIVIEAVGDGQHILRFPDRPGSHSLHSIGEGFFGISGVPGYYLSTVRDESGAPGSILLVQPNGVFRLRP